MTLSWVLQTAFETISAPGTVARQLRDMRLGRHALLMSFALVAVLNTLVFSASVLTLPQDDMTRQVFGSPLVFMAIFMGTLAVTTVALTWVGRMLGGTADLFQMATLTIWMQVLRFLAQVGLAVLSWISVALASFAVVAVSVLGLWILLNFVNVAHGFGSLVRSAVVLIGSVFGMAMVLTVLLTLAGVGTTGP